MIWTDHKNLAHPQSAKRLNSCQDRWVMFISCFKFTHTYCLGFCNSKPNVLSCLFSPKSPLRPRSQSFFSVENMVKNAQNQQPDPCTGPDNRLFVPDSVHSQVLHWEDKLACHSGATLTLLKRQFWWPGKEKGTWSYVAACITCAHSKASHQAPAGLLHPLPIPNRPCSHIALDLVTGHPPSQGRSTIMTIVDRFSKAVHFVFLPKLPSAMETAQHS